MSTSYLTLPTNASLKRPMASTMYTHARGCVWTMDSCNYMHACWQCIAWQHLEQYISTPTILSE